MWKKEGVPDQSYAPPVEPAPRPERVMSSPAQAAPATIGRSITIRGEVTGDEDLLIQGRVEGSVDLKQHAVTVGRDGQVKADITGHVVTVEGSVQGNLTATEQVVLRSSARVQGDITAPRVVLEDGARFRGGVDMGEVAENTTRPAAREGAQSPPPGRDTIEVAAGANTSAADARRDRPKLEPQPAAVAR